MAKFQIFGGIIGLMVAGPVGAKVGWTIGTATDLADIIMPIVAPKEKEIPASSPTSNTVSHLPSTHREAVWIKMQNKSISVECPHCQTINTMNVDGTLWKCGHCTNKYSFNVTNALLEKINDTVLLNHAYGLHQAFYLYGIIAKADGHVSESEARLVNEIMMENKMDFVTQDSIIRFFNRGRDEGNIRYATNSLKSLYKNNQDVLYSVIEDLARIAMSDGVFHTKEKEVLKKITVDEFEFSKNYFEQVCSIKKIAA